MLRRALRHRCLRASPSGSAPVVTSPILLPLATSIIATALSSSSVMKSVASSGLRRNNSGLLPVGIERVTVIVARSIT